MENIRAQGLQHCPAHI
uniref:Uncharacterized protein n=1 Tax=Arundo donax TaxID=35708 RepID=A0A0A9EC89_ARUDO